MAKSVNYNGLIGYLIEEVKALAFEVGRVYLVREIAQGHQRRVQTLGDWPAV